MRKHSVAKFITFQKQMTHIPKIYIFLLEICPDSKTRNYKLTLLNLVNPDNYLSELNVEGILFGAILTMGFGRGLLFTAFGASTSATASSTATTGILALSTTAVIIDDGL